MGGLRWHAVCVGRLLRSTEGVGAESHTVAKVAQGGMFEESRGRGGAALCAGKQLGVGGVVLAGWHASRVRIRRAVRRWRRGRRGAGSRGAGSLGAGSRGVGRRGTRALWLSLSTWVGVEG